MIISSVISVILLQLIIITPTYSFHFPDSYIRDKKDAGPEPISPCPNNEDFCQDIDDYPAQAAVLSPDLVNSNIVRQKIFQTQIQRRISDFIQESRACDHRKSTVYPKKARNVAGSFVFIVNDEEYKQAVEIEQCLGDGLPCRTEDDVSFGRTVCRQKYTTYKMFVINQEGDQVYDSFSLPSACLCHHKSDFAIRGPFLTAANGHEIDQLPFCPKAQRLQVQTKTDISTNQNQDNQLFQRVENKFANLAVVSNGEPSSSNSTFSLDSNDKTLSVLSFDEKGIEKIEGHKSNNDNEDNNKDKMFNQDNVVNSDGNNRKGSPIMEDNTNVVCTEDNTTVLPDIDNKNITMKPASVVHFGDGESEEIQIKKTKTQTKSDEKNIKGQVAFENLNITTKPETIINFDKKEKSKDIKINVTLQTLPDEYNATNKLDVNKPNNIKIPKSKVHFGRKKRQANKDSNCSETISNVCESPTDYPDSEMIAALLTDDHMSHKLFKQLFDSQCQEIRRRGFNIDEEQLCYGVPKIIFPKKARNLREEWKFVVNIENYTQSVEVEECDNTTRDFHEYDEVLENQLQDENNYGVCLYSGSEGNNPDLTVCRQIYTEHKLLALSNENQLEVDSFKLPSACACFVKEDLILEFRNGIGSGQSENIPLGRGHSENIPLPPQVETVQNVVFVQG